MSRKVWGLVRSDGYAYATYFVHWTVGHVFDHGANFDVILGKWGKGRPQPIAMLCASNIVSWTMGRA